MNIILEQINLVQLGINGVLFIIFVYVARRIVNRLYERDITFKEIRAIHNGPTFEEILAIKAKKDNKSKSSKLMQLELVIKLLDQTRKKFLLMDEDREVVVVAYILAKYVFPVIITIIAIPLGLSGIARALIGSFLFISMIDTYMSFKQKDHQKHFENHSYRLFKFINNQRSAGVPTQSIITKLHMAVKEPKLEKRLISFAAEYIAKGKYDDAFQNNIIKYYSSTDARALDVALRQGLNVGDKYSISDEGEEVMFEKYMAFIDHETEKKKMLNIVIAVFFAVSLIGIVGFPLVMDMFNAVETIFSS